MELLMYIEAKDGQYTYIFMVPLGPRFVLKTSCRPFAALMLIANACVDRATSALGLSDFIADIT